MPQESYDTKQTFPSFPQALLPVSVSGIGTRTGRKSSDALIGADRRVPDACQSPSPMAFARQHLARVGHLPNATCRRTIPGDGTGSSEPDDCIKRGPLPEAHGTAGSVPSDLSAAAYLYPGGNAPISVRRMAYNLDREQLTGHSISHSELFLLRQAHPVWRSRANRIVLLAR